MRDQQISGGKKENPGGTVDATAGRSEVEARYFVHSLEQKPQKSREAGTDIALLGGTCRAWGGGVEVGKTDKKGTHCKLLATNEI